MVLGYPYFWDPNLSWWRAGAGTVVPAACFVIAIVWLLVMLCRARSHALLKQQMQERTGELEQRNRELALEIAERQRVEAALRASESRFRRLAESGVIGILIADMRGEIVEANAAFLDMLGYSEADLTAGRLRWTDVTPPEWSEHDARAVLHLQTSGIIPAWEKECFHKDGKRVPILLGGAVLEGSPDLCVCFTLDLSQRKSAEAALEQMRAQHALDVRFRELLDTAPDAMVVSGGDGRISFLNVQAELLFGYTRAELIGQQIDLLIPTRFRAEHGQHLNRFFQDPSARPMGGGIALYGLRKDKTEFPIEVSLSPLHTSEGITVSAAVRDISDRKRLEAATRLFAERLSSAVDSIEDAFALFDNKDRLVLCNGGYRQLVESGLPGGLVGRPYGELLDAFLGQIVFANDEERAAFCAQRLSRRGQASAPFDIKLRDGRTMRVIDRPTPEGGSVKTIRDLTDDVHLTEELRSARIAAESASTAKSEFLSSMSHELRTPLNAILGFAQLLQRDRKEPLSERHLERVGRILTGGEHLLHLIDDILDLSRIEAGRVALSIEPLRVTDVLLQVKSTLEALAARNHVQIQLDSVPSTLPLIAADVTRFSQILLNFASNAIKYNRPSGKVVFDVAKPATGWLRVIVRDTGIGIPLDQQDKLFQAFQRAGQEMGTVEGTGIGLFITKRLAELMHGDIGFRSAPGEGSEFWVDMPIYEGPSTTMIVSSRKAAVLEESMQPESQKNILYIEDNPISVELMRDIIDSLDHIALVTAPTAERGLEMARAHKPELVLMDINLPGMNGLEAMKELQKDAALQHVPVIALSAAASRRDRERGLEAGFYAYLTKPLDINAFVALIQKLLA